MAADTATSQSAPPCPDPAAHDHHNRLSAQASTAALLATGKGNHSRNSSIQSESVLGPDGKLSSKSAATSLKYANAQDLPSFPSSGNVSGSAGKAAMLANDYKMKELWHPEQSAAGSKAALLAANKGAKLDLWEAKASAEGQSAATLAFRNKGLSPQAYGGNSAENKSKALMAATGATQQSRARATSTPQAPPPLYPDQANASKNALSAATASTRDGGWNDPANQAARVTHLGENVSGKMFTGTPDWRYEEDKHQAGLRASAVAMAQSLYANQNRDNMLLEPDGSDLAGARSAARAQAIAHPDVKQEALQYISLQDKAHRLAAERLAKIDKDMEGKRFREHYGYGDKQPKSLSSRMSLRSSGTSERRGRQRASSDSNRGRYDSDSENSDDERQAGRIRAQMAGLRTATGQVDAKKQQDDRAKLLAAAEKRVSARMADMDSQVYRDTGKVSPAMIEEWEAKAREKAERQRQERALNPGKTHIGGGQFMDQSEIEAIAAARLKPTLDEISATAASRRQHDEEMRIEKDKQQTARMEEKIARQQEKDRQKAIKTDLRESSKREKAEEKARLEEDKRAAQAEQRKSREVKRDATSTLPVGGVEFGKTHEVHDEPTESTVATDGREKHQSALARLKAKFRTTGSHEKTTETEPTIAGKPTHTGTAVAGGAAAGAVTGATLADLDKKDAPTQLLDAQQATHAVVRDTTTPASITTADGAHDTTYHTEPAVSPLAENEKELGTTAATGDSSYEAEWKAGGAAPTAATTVVPTVPIVHDHSESDADGEESLNENRERQTRPVFTQTGSVSGFANDTVPTVSHGERMATLERHISHIPDSEDDLSSDNEDWNDERAPRTHGAVADEEPGTVALAAGPITPAVAQEPETASTDRWFPPAAVAGVASVGAATAVATHESEAEHPPRTMGDVYDSTPATSRELAPAPVIAEQTTSPPHPANIVSSETNSRMEDQRAEASADMPAGLQTPGVPRDTSAPDTASMVAIPPASVTSSPITAVGKQKLKDEEDVPAVATSAPAIPLQGQPVSSGLTSQGKEPVSPIKTEIKTEHEKATPVALMGQPVSSGLTSHDRPEPANVIPSTDKDKKGVRGLLSKFRSKPLRSEKSPGIITSGSASKYDESKYENKSVPYESTKAGERPTVSNTNLARNEGSYDKSATDAALKQVNPAGVPVATTTASTIPPVDTGAEFSSSTVQPTSSDASTKETSILQPITPSAYAPVEKTTEDVSSDDERGRGKTSFAKKLGFGRNKDAHVKDGKLHKPAPGADSDPRRVSRSTDDDNDNFEEARDHFDESLAPPAAFSGAKKSESPVRETRFKEDV